MKHLPYSLLVAASLFLLPLPAEASRLSNWKFDNGQNRLEFSTDQDVQPKAQLVVDPTRLVIDLPGIILGRPSFTQSVSSRGIRSVRFGQFDRGTTRIVVELAPGYTLDPNQVKFRGVTARQWTVQLPTPERLASTPSIQPAEVTGSSSRQPAVYVVPAVIAPVTSGAMLNRPQPVPRNTGGPGNVSSRSPRNLAALPPSASLTTIESVQLENGGGQLVIQANQPLQYESGWNRRNGFYQITLKSARLAKQIKGPQLDASSSVLAVRLRQEDSRTVVILVQPAAGVQINNLNQPGEQTLALQLQKKQTVPFTPRRNPIATIPVPAAPRSSSPPPFIPRVPNGKIVVVVDPGHGGPDPGAVGISGLQEKGIVLDIGTQVANLLEKQGVQAVLTRRDDIDLDLEPRVQLAEQIRATVFVSIHANSIDLSRPDVNGLETYYYQNGEELARTIHSSILESTGIPDRRVRTARFYVLRKTSMPSVLVEVGFVTGRDDAARLANPSYRSQMAAAIARGILQYIQRAARS